MAYTDTLTKEILDQYTIKLDLSNAEFKVLVIEKQSMEVIGIVKVVCGRWRVSVDVGFETSELKEAIKRCIEVYTRFRKEFNEINEKYFNKD